MSDAAAFYAQTLDNPMRRHEPDGVCAPELPNSGIALPNATILAVSEPEQKNNGIHESGSQRHEAGNVRLFDTGATRSPDAGRYDPEGFLSPLSIERYCLYMAKNQVQSDGTLRSSDNWQKGMPIASYMKGMWRHFLHLWTRHRGYAVQDPKAAADAEEDLCALLFNVQGMLHEIVKARLAK
jgi:hypothetical protein